MRLADLNSLDEGAAVDALLRCCVSTRWAGEMADARPFADAGALAAAGDAVWASLAPADWLEAFAAHPRIGETRVVGGAGGSGESGASDWSQQEQAGVAAAAEATRRRLADANRLYEARF